MVPQGPEDLHAYSKGTILMSLHSSCLLCRLVSRTQIWRAPGALPGAAGPRRAAAARDQSHSGCRTRARRCGRPPAQSTAASPSAPHQTPLVPAAEIATLPPPVEPDSTASPVWYMSRKTAEYPRSPYNRSTPWIWGRLSLYCTSIPLTL